MRFDDTESIKAMVGSGLGMSMLPYWCVAPNIARGELALVRQKERKLQCGVAVVRGRSAGASGPARAFAGIAKTFDGRRLRLAPD